ncbi:hypothetical protein K3G39_14345 [Pontibacter sp. HSC-14F20]|uniref:hypothetical protein n=1 Tax=Pontibacter sp. HSC-14F20 TaxID=2864136 RepID=UPI001C730CA9|nr:hypothetical protein [Pontibacter sp. HSC-14F20]MBX0334419.1 hypothetical protein [Pontibacter sp. HSC-14F20]
MSDLSFSLRDGAARYSGQSYRNVSGAKPGIPALKVRSYTCITVLKNVPNGFSNDAIP